MEQNHDTARRSALSWQALAFATALSAFLIGAVLHMHYRWGVPMGTLTQDPLFHRPVYLGFLSQVGILLWAAAAAVCFIVAIVLRARGGARNEQAFFWSAGWLTTLLGIDDAFMLHDVVLPDQLGVPESIVYALYAGAVLAFVAVFFRRLLASEYATIVIAFAFFALSILADVRELPGLDPFLLEDGAKAIGIVAWVTYFFRTGVHVLR